MWPYNEPRTCPGCHPVCALWQQRQVEQTRLQHEGAVEDGKSTNLKFQTETKNCLHMWIHLETVVSYLSYVFQFAKKCSSSLFIPWIFNWGFLLFPFFLKKKKGKEKKSSVCNVSSATATESEKQKNHLCRPYVLTPSLCRGQSAMCFVLVDIPPPPPQPPCLCSLRLPWPCLPLLLPFVFILI